MMQGQGMDMDKLTTSTGNKGWKGIAQQYIRNDNGRFHCKLCTAQSFEYCSYAERHFTNAHGKHHIKNGDEYIFICKKGCAKRGHYHCSHCSLVFQKKDVCERHIAVCVPTKVVAGSSNLPSGLKSTKAGIFKPMDTESCDDIPIKNFQNNNNVDVSDVDVVIPQSKHINPHDGMSPEDETKVHCTECDAEPMYKRNLKVHMQRKHSPEQTCLKTHNGVCVDRLNGIYLVSETRKGIQHPVHVQKLLSGSVKKVYCESEKCQNQKIYNGVSGNPSYECPHELSIPFIKPTPEINLEQDTLDKLVEEGRLEQDTARTIARRKRESLITGINLVGAMTPEFCSERYMFFSVDGFRKRHNAVIDRYLVTFDKTEFKLVCNCKIGRTCEHKSIAKWYLRSEYPDVLINPTKQSITTVALNNAQGVSVEHEFNFKLSNSLSASSESFEQLIIIPSETKCCSMKCTGTLVLHECYKDVKLLTRDGIVTISNVWTKICQKCKTVVNYCGVADGVFNFNNKFFMSVTLLLWLRVGIRQHIAVSKTINIIETIYGCHVDHNRVRRTFYKFLALFDEEENFRCYLCGYHSVILTMDVSRKVCFKLKDMVDDGGNHCHQVNAKDFWANLSKYVISPESDRSIRPSVDNWAPFLPECSRRGDMLHNTEALKGIQGSDDQEFLECLSEERLEGILENTDLKLLRELCVECGFDAVQASKASEAKCIEILKKAMKDHVSIDKFFIKAWHSSGGLLTGSCPHGIVYCLKFLLKPESVRDYGDMILNFKYPPSVVISDIPHMVAAHLNKRLQQDFFYPNCGRVVEPTDYNIQRASELSVSIPWLQKRSETLLPNLNLANIDIHPITLTSQHLSLYDDFHKGNTKQKKEFLRRTGQVKELVGLNTETAEQTNSFLKNSLSFIDCMSPVHHLLVVKAMLSQKNFEVNKKILGNRKPILDVFGRLTDPGLGGAKRKILTNPADQPRNVKSSDGIDFIVSNKGNPEPPLKKPALLPKLSASSVEKDAMHQKVPIATTLSNSLFNSVKTLFKGLHNPLNNCWFNSCMTAIRYSLGSSTLYEDLNSKEDIDQYDYYCIEFELIIKSLGLNSTPEPLQFNLLKSCLEKSFIAEKLGVEQDPTPFFLISAGIIDEISTNNLEMLPWYQFKEKSTFTCLGCGIYSEEEVSSILLSVPILPDLSCDIIELIDNYFKDEEFERLCNECGSQKHAVARRLSSCPKVLAIQIKRYSSDIAKHSNVVVPSEKLDITSVIDDSSKKRINSKYKLRSVVTHTGSSLQTGHFTTVFFEQGLCVEVDGVKISLLHDRNRLLTGGYILFYEKEDVVEAMSQKLHRWTPLMSLMNINCSSVLGNALKNWWSDLSINSVELSSKWLMSITDIIIRTTSLYCLSATSQVKSYSFRDMLHKQPTNLFGHTEKSAKIMLGMIGYIDYHSYFMMEFACGVCNLKQKQVKEYFTIPGDIETFLGNVAIDFQEKECFSCDMEMRHSDDTAKMPCLLSEMVILSSNSPLNSTGVVSLMDDPKSVVDFCYVKGGISEKSAVFVKDDNVYSLEGSNISVENQLSVNDEKLIILMGEHVKKYSWVSSTNAVIRYESQELDYSSRLELCLPYFIGKEEIVQCCQEILLGRIPTPEFACYFFQTLATSLKYLSFTQAEFENTTLGAILIKLKVQIQIDFLVVDFPDVIYVVNVKSGRISVTGNLIEQFLEKIVQLAYLIDFTPRKEFLVTKFEVDTALSKVEQLKICYCVIRGMDVKLETRPLIPQRLITLMMLIKADSSNIGEVLKNNCHYIDWFDDLKKDDKRNYQIHCANEGIPFSLPLLCTKVASEIKNIFDSRLHLCGILNERLCFHILDFVEKHTDILKSYFLLDDNVDPDDKRRIKLLYSDPKFKRDKFRSQLAYSTWKKMERFFPPMMVMCVYSVLEYMFTDRTRKAMLDNYMIEQEPSHSNYIEVILTKVVLHRYAHEICGEKEEVIVNMLGLVGEEEICVELEEFNC